MGTPHSSELSLQDLQLDIFQIHDDLGRLNDGCKRDASGRPLVREELLGKLREVTEKIRTAVAEDSRMDPIAADRWAETCLRDASIPQL